jgi:trans-aconitate 2-methyltransferase
MRDPTQYALFSDERSRPFFTLLSRVPALPYREIVDLGCGSGELTKHIAQRFPDAHVTGVDISPQMLERSSEYAEPGRLDFVQGDIAAYDQPSDLVFSNAALQWLEGHDALFPRLAALVKHGGVLAVQMPDNFHEPSHTLIEQTARRGPWASKLAGYKTLGVQPLRFYLDILLGLGLQVEAWSTTYQFILQGEDAVLEWMKGTTLQPIFALLDEDAKRDFLAAYGAALREQYPRTPHGTFFPFRRMFFIASRPV